MCKCNNFALLETQKLSFPRTPYRLEKRPGKISFPAIVCIQEFAQTYLNDSPTADKIQNIFELKQNISSRLQFK